MNWQNAKQKLATYDLKGELFQGATSSGTSVRSSAESLEIGPLSWELPKFLIFDRLTGRWFYKQSEREYYDEEEGWTHWMDAGAAGVSALALLDPISYLSVETLDEGEERPLFYDLTAVKVRFNAKHLFETLGMPGELIPWCLDLAGEYHDVVFLWRREDSLEAIVQRDIWLTGEPVTVAFQGARVPPFVIDSSLAL